MEGTSSPLRSATMIGISEAARVLQALGICKAFVCSRKDIRLPNSGWWKVSLRILIALVR